MPALSHSSVFCVAVLLACVQTRLSVSTGYRPGVAEAVVAAGRVDAVAAVADVQVTKALVNVFTLVGAFVSLVTFFALAAKGPRRVDTDALVA
uniref:Secreted protein n=1 Tax=Ixodes ricinus TaxID=34613 RepID=A0A6B0U288_IXORI